MTGGLFFDAFFFRCLLLLMLLSPIVSIQSLVFRLLSRSLAPSLSSAREEEQETRASAEGERKREYLVGNSCLSACDFRTLFRLQ